MTPEGFDGLEITDTVARALAADGIRKASSVQAAAFGPLLAGRNVLLHASTGSGKTLAYLLPILQQLRDPEAGRAVVFAPGTELALQVLRVADAYKDEAVSTGSAVATTSHRRQRERVQRSTRLVVGTPDRLLELFRDGKLKGTRFLVLDELEPILAGPGAELLDTWLARSEPKVQLIVASATLGPRSKAFAERWLKDAVRVEPTEDALTDAIGHHVVRVPTGRSKEVVLARFVQEAKVRRAMVFVADPDQQAYLYHYLLEHGLRPATLTEHRSKNDRRAALEAFREGEARLLLVSDVTARGLDVTGVDWVLHYDLPRTAQVYVHRAGRTGRAGRRGDSIAFCEDAARGHLRRIAEELGIRFQPVSAPEPARAPRGGTPSGRRGR